MKKLNVANIFHSCDKETGTILNMMAELKGQFNTQNMERSLQIMSGQLLEAKEYLLELQDSETNTLLQIENEKGGNKREKGRKKREKPREG